MSEKSSATVTVACKLPNGLLIQLFEPYSVQVPILGGGTREELRHRRVGETYHIRGPIAPFGQVPKTEIAAGYALNTGVPRDLWEKWLEQNADSDLVRNKIVFAHGAAGDARDEAKEHEKTKTGIEPLDTSFVQKGDRKVMADSRIRALGGGIEPGDRPGA